MSYSSDTMMTTPSFVVVPGTLLSMRLPPVELAVLMQLVKLAQQGSTSPSSQTLSGLTGVPRNEVIDAVNNLDKKRLLRGGKVIAVLPTDSTSNPNPPIVPVSYTHLTLPTIYSE